MIMKSKKSQLIAEIIIKCYIQGCPLLQIGLMLKSYNILYHYKMAHLSFLLFPKLLGNASGLFITVSRVYEN